MPASGTYSVEAVRVLDMHRTPIQKQPKALLCLVEPPVVRESRKRGHEGIDANAPPKSLRRDHADLRPSGSSRGGKSLAAMQL
nr:hypothetical protein [Tanacetum cinerariifolium]